MWDLRVGEKIVSFYNSVSIIIDHFICHNRYVFFVSSVIFCLKVLHFFFSLRDKVTGQCLIASFLLMVSSSLVLTVMVICVYLDMVPMIVMLR